MSRRAVLAAAALLALAWPALAQRAPSAVDRLDEAQLREAVRLAGASLADLESGNLGRAEQALRELARLLPDNLLPQVNLAIVYLQLDRTDDALRAVERARAIDPENPQALYTLARLLQPAAGTDPAARERWEDTLAELERAAPRDPRPHWLRARERLAAGRPADALAPLAAAIERSRDNLVLLVDRLAASAAAGDVDAAIEALDAVEDRLNGFDPRAESLARRARDAAFEGDAQALRPPALMIENLLRPTDLYQVGRAELEGRDGGSVLFPQLEFDPPLPKSVQGGQDVELALVDVTSSWLPRPPGAVAALDLERAAGPADDPETGHDEPADALLVLLEDGAIVRLGRGAGNALEVAPSGRAPLAAGGGSATLLSYDLDQDETADLLAHGAQGLLLARGDGAVEWEKVAAHGELRFVLPVDLDHDGDLDLLLGRPGGMVYLQNRGGGGLVDATAELGVGAIDARAAAIADFDGDGDLDLAVAAADGVRVLDNRRAGVLVPQAALDPGAGAVALAAGDLDQDGRFDLVLGGAEGLRALYNRLDGWSALDLPRAPGGAAVEHVALVDLDLDGDLDVVAASGDRLEWLRNRRAEGFVAEPPVALEAPARAVVPFDADGDGDLDLAVRGAGGALRLLRNDGGERNQWLALRLRGLNDSNAKNNTQGLHARVEVRVGAELHTLIGNGGVNRIGLGSRRQADVLRVVWTNGLSQTWQQLGARQTVVEEQVLKGSCPFLYTWDGEGFSFVTDLMWRSTLGMIFADGSPAPHQSARDWVLIPGERLRPAGDDLWLQVTDELWETIYVDRQSLLAVDHPAELELVVDETFGPPPFPAEPPLHLVARRLAPSAARDQDGADRLAEVAARDRRYVGDLPRTRHQGVTSGHSLELEFTGVDAEGPLDLLLWGWVFPADTTINFALAQDPTRGTAPPALEVRAPGGAWRTLLPSIGLPLGKDKAMVVRLADLLEPGERAGGALALRIVSTMEVYWDAAALAPGTDPRAGTLRTTRLEPIAADLHFRGASRLVRESPDSPHRFDYRQVDPRPPFPPMAGAHTRYGEVTELVLHEDDRTVVMSPGDELTLRYSAAGLPPLPAGWTRDWVLYTDGWVKDADLHTTASQTVEPLPFHAMRGYPGDPAASPASDPAFRRYLERYQTRVLPR
jgi:tetratricopeptide (TPR) repeat protein